MGRLHHRPRRCLVLRQPMGVWLQVGGYRILWLVGFKHRTFRCRLYAHVRQRHHRHAVAGGQQASEARQLQRRQCSVDSRRQHTDDRHARRQHLARDHRSVADRSGLGRLPPRGQPDEQPRCLQLRRRVRHDDRGGRRLLRARGQPVRQGRRRRHRGDQHQDPDRRQRHAVYRRLAGRRGPRRMYSATTAPVRRSVSMAARTAF